MAQGSSSSSSKLNTTVGIICMLLAASLWALWLYVYNAEPDPVDRTLLFNSYFPAFLNGEYTKSWIAALLCLLSIYLCAQKLQKKTVVLQTVSIIVIIISGLLMLITLFSLL